MDSKSKSDNFKRLAENRTNKIIRLVQLLGNLSNTSNYEYSDKQVEQIFKAIEDEVRIQKAKFQKSRNKQFKL